MTTPEKRIVRTLSMTELFVDLEPEQLDLVSKICEVLDYEKGDILFKENTSSDEMYVIGRGLVEVLVDPSFVSADEGMDSVIIAELRQGDLLGEMALVDQGLRSATARIGADNTFLLRLPRRELMDLCRQHPALGFTLMYNLAADLALKIRNTDLTLRQYQLQLMYQKPDA